MSSHQLPEPSGPPEELGPHRPRMRSPPRVDVVMAPSTPTRAVETPAEDTFGEAPSSDAATPVAGGAGTPAEGAPDPVGAAGAVGEGRHVQFLGRWLTVYSDEHTRDLTIVNHGALRQGAVVTSHHDGSAESQPTVHLVNAAGGLATRLAGAQD